MDPSDELVFDYPPYMQQHKSGRVVRLNGTVFVPASIDLSTGVVSKDVVIDPITDISVRLYLPNLANAPSKKLTILVYYHGGAFIIQSTSSPTYHNYLNSLAAEAGVLIVSVDYRRAPEHHLPTAHDDSRAALKWVASHSAGQGDPWLAEHGDFDRVFVAGDSAGGNIAHHMALCSDVKLEGVALIHPFFWGKEPIGNETTNPVVRLPVEILWRVVYPAMEGLDDPLINPLAAGAPSLKWLRCKRVIVFVAGNDVLKERGKAYYESLDESGWGGEAEFMESEGEGHVFHLINPDSDPAVAMMERMVAFLTKE